MSTQPPLHPVNILLTSAGRRVELLRAFRRAYGALRLPGNIVAVDADPLAPALGVANRSYLLPQLSSPAYIPALLSVCAKEQVRLVFPLIDPDIPLLAAHSADLAAVGAEAVVAPESAVLITRDKWRMYHYFRELGLPTPRTWLPEELDPDAAVYPLFIRPRLGSAGKGAFKVEVADQLRFFTRYVRAPIIQEFLPGPEITTDVACGLDGRLLAVVSRKRIEVRSGEVSKGVTVHDPVIHDACVRLAKAFRPKGQITVQCLLKEGAPFFTEINARFGGGAPLGIEAGCDLPRWLLAEAAGLPVEAPPLGAYRVGLYMTRCDESFFLSETDLGRIERGPV